jgi:hypothetical protein
MRRFTPEEVATLVEMARAGCDGNTIATELGRDALSVRHKASALGVSLRRQRPTNDLRFVMDEGAFAKLKEAARARGTSVARLARLLLEIISRNELVDETLENAVALRAFVLSENAVPKRNAP